ncbi:cytochrome b/b6 domain-containing protein [Micrococcus terreus]|uniref:cytochrome b/b6 domain-containing protein n=1 Tax=Micrococcus terreus TaxID=574650 RepID=UPI0023F7193A|nr:cytochrome b/b6 domain-containing protein [Micrococcus terreus]
MAKQRMAGYTPLRGAPQAPEQESDALAHQAPVQQVPTTATHLPQEGSAAASAPVETTMDSAAPVESSTTAETAPAAPVQKQRMAGYTPLRGGTNTPGTAASVSAPAAEQPTTTAPAAQAATEGTAARQEVSSDGADVAAQAAPAPAQAAPSAPAVQKQRMAGYTPLRTQSASTPTAEVPAAQSAPPIAGAAPAAEQSSPAAAPASEQAAPAPAKQRMGGQPRRMGAPAAPSAAQASAPAVAAGSADTASSAPAAVPGPSEQEQEQAPAAPKPAAAAIQKPVAAAGGAETEPAQKAPWPLWKRAVVGVGVAVLAALVMVMLARWARTMPGVQEFIATYDGHAPQPQGTPEGIPAWLGWQHFLNMFFIVLIVRTGLQVRMEKRPPGYWKPKQGGFFSPKGNTVKKVSLSQWLHQVLDVAWVANGAVFIVLLAITGHWARIVPTSWEIFPHMGSVAIQYASLDWPTENGWIHYNALQVMAYFITVYIAAPLAILTGLRMSTWWPQKATGLNRVFPIEAARALHFPVMLYFVGFTLVHVFLVFFTGALRNLNHMYTSRDVTDWWGLIIFLGSVAVIAAAWFLTRPVFTTPLAQKTGTVTKN